MQHDFTGNNPFTALAHRDASGSGGYSNSVSGRVVKETILSDRLANPLVSVPEDNGYASYFGSGGTNVKTSIINNGLNDHGTDVLDFQYSFPIDKQNGGTSDPTWRQYAPMSSANAQWDQERSSDNENAQYKALNSGQGLGTGTTAMTIDANWTATTESSGGGGSFTGYKVTQRNFSRSTDNLLNSTVNGSTVADGTGTQTLLGQYGSGFDGTNGFRNSEFETVTLPETFNYFGQSFTHIYVNENGFLSFGNGGLDQDKPWYDYSFDNNTTLSLIHISEPTRR